MKNNIIENFKNKKKTVGTFTHMKSMEAIEAIGISGMEFIVIDMEHCPVDISEAATYVTAANAAGITPLMRVNSITRPAILQGLDIGVKGLIVPCIKTVDQVRELVSYAKYRPVGERGYCMTRDGKWGYDSVYDNGLKGYMKDANEDNLLILQCETVECLNQIEEIVDIDGVDGIMVGPNDLSIAMNMPGQFKNPEFLKGIDRVVRACKKAGKMSFIFCHDANEANEKLEQGFDNAIVGIDLLTLISTYRQILEDIKR